MGGGGITSLKQILVANDANNISNIVKDGNYTITYSADSEYNNQIDCLASNSANYLAVNVDRWWCSNPSSFPHYWQVDLGRVIPKVCKFIFNPSDDVINVRVKDYEIFYSLDGINFNKLYSGTFIPDHTITDHVWQDEECEFNPVSLRYFRITILNSYDNRGYTWGGFTNARLYARNNGLYLKESDNNIYGSVDNEITQISTLDTWNNSSIEDKKNFFLFTNGVLSVDQLKSLGKFKVLNEPNN